MKSVDKEESGYGSFGAERQLALGYGSRRRVTPGVKKLMQIREIKKFRTEPKQH